MLCKPNRLRSLSSVMIVCDHSTAASDSVQEGREVNKTHDSAVGSGLSGAESDEELEALCMEK